MSTIITKNSTIAGNVPLIITQGELAINTADGKLFYGSGSIAKEFTASLAISASYLIGGGTGLPGGSNTSVQFNDEGNFSGSNTFTFDKVNNFLFITGSLNLFSQGGQSTLTIISGSDKVFTVTGSGVAVFGTYGYTPSAEEGGIYFNGNDFFLGF
jgi:hypothetical protein